MRKLFAAVLFSIFVPGIACAEVYINEIMYDLPGNDESQEWVEIFYNDPVRDLSGWKFIEAGINHGLTYIRGGNNSSSIVTTGEYIIIADDSSQFLSEHPSFTGKLFDSSFSLSNTGETLNIADGSGNVYSSITYNSSDGANGDGKSLQRQSNNSWLTASSTPGSENSIGSETSSSTPTISISGVISSDVTWSSDEGVYILENAVTVSASTTLTIMPGTIIKARHGGAGSLIIEGNLVATGTAESKIYFTSLLDDAIGGDTDATGTTTGAMKDWVGIYFKPGSSGNLDYVTVRYAGYIGVGSNSGIDNDGGTVEIRNSIITDNYLRGINSHSGSVMVSDSIIENNFYGLFGYGGEMSVQNSVIRNNSGAGLDAIGIETITLIGNSFFNNGKTARVDAGAIFTHSGNTSNDLTNKGFELSGNVDNNVTWYSGDLPIIIPASNTVWVNASSTLTINPGSVVKFGSAAGIIVEGNLVSEGTKESKIYLTSLKNDSLAGDTNNDGVSSTPGLMDWNGIEFHSGSMGEIASTIIEYTGGWNGTNRSAIYNAGGSLALNNIEFYNNFENDIYHGAGSSTITHSQFSTSTTYAIFNSGTNSIDARSNWWGTGTGPTHVTNATGTGQTIGDNVLFSPWLGRDPALPNPVIIVPGIMATKLLEDKIIDDLVWPNTVQIVTSITDDFLDILKMDDFGLPIWSTIITGDIIKSLPNVDYWEGLLNQLISENYLENSDLFEFPYDWRLDIETLASNLNSKIEEVKILTGAEKVDLVAHSMGGLLVKEYLNSYNGNSVGKFIDIGTPHAGSPSAYKILTYGDNLGVNRFFDLININKNEIFEISQNMPAVYQLLPSQEYFNNPPDYYVLDMTDGNNRYDFTQTKDYLKSQGRNSALVDRADQFHQEIDNLNPADYGIETYNIVGCGTPTIGQFYILEDGRHPIYNIRMINGDGTVPLKSAEAISATNTYYVKDAQHATMPSTSGVKELITSILTEDNFNISSYSNMAMTSTGCDIPNGKLVSFHSPIELHVYDGSGNHAGPDANSDIENEISGVVYEEIGDNKFAFLPEGMDYIVKGAATNTGTFDVRIQEIIDGEVATTTLFTNIPLTLTTQAQFDIGANIPAQIYLDNENDGVFESNYAISTTTAGILESTGKTPTITMATAAEAPILGSSRPSVEKIIEPETTSFPEVLGITTSTPVVEISQVVEAPKSTIIETPATENTAIVYKSFGQKLKGVFKTLWSWIKSKL